MDTHDVTSSRDRSSSDETVSLVRTGALPQETLGSVTNELVARLARRIPAQSSALPGLLAPADPGELDAFCETLISEDVSYARSFFQALRTRGMTTDRLCLSYLAPAARRLGEDWNADRLGCLEVTLGSARLHSLLRTMHSDFSPRAMHYRPELTAVMAAVPGETHVLGVTMAANFFRRAGWHVDLQCDPDADMLCALAASGQYRLVGLSAGCESVYENLKSLVHRLRKQAPDVKIALAGNLIAMEPGIVDELGADASAMDVSVAPSSLERLVLTYIKS